MDGGDRADNDRATTVVEDGGDEETDVEAATVPAPVLSAADEAKEGSDDPLVIEDNMDVDELRDEADGQDVDEEHAELLDVSNDTTTPSAAAAAVRDGSCTTSSSFSSPFALFSRSSSYIQDYGGTL